MITINEFARRICVANHQRLDQANPLNRVVPCQEHRTIANQSWGLIQKAGAKTLGTILAIALEEGANPEFGITVAGIVRASHMEGDVRMIDKIEVTAASVVPASSRFPATPAEPVSDDDDAAAMTLFYTSPGSPGAARVRTWSDLTEPERDHWRTLTKPVGGVPHG